MSDNSYDREIGRLAESGRKAVMMTQPGRPCRTDVKLGKSGGIFCACDDLIKTMLRDTPEAVISRAGCIALFVLAGTFAGRVWAKILHKNGELTCYTYRKVKDMVNVQPWFCIPLITVPVINYNSVSPWRPPFVAYAALVGGWMLNSAGHVLLIASKDEKFKRYCVPASYMALGLSGIISLLALFSRRPQCCC